MQWDVGVAPAIATAKSERCPLLVLVEPPNSVTSGRNIATENASQLFGRLATRSLHNRLFTNPNVLKIINLARIRCVRFPADISNSDYASFSTFFSVKQPTPNMFLIAPDTGLVLYRLNGYVSPIKFQCIVTSAVKTVSGRIIEVPEPESLPPGSSLPERTESFPQSLENRGSVSVAGSLLPTDDALSALRNPNPTSFPRPEVPLHSSSTAARDGNPNQNSSKFLKLPGRTRVRARLPDGRQIEKGFDAGIKFRLVRTWLQEELATSNIVVSSAFPRYVFTAADDSKSLTELKLIPSTTLVVSNNATVDTAPSRPSRPVAFVTSAITVVSSFIRSFFAPPVPPDGDAEDAHNAPSTGSQTGGTIDDSTNTTRTNHEHESADSSDQLWLSNGNSTQFGWNSADIDNERE